MKLLDGSSLKLISINKAAVILDDFARDISHFADTLLVMGMPLELNVEEDKFHFLRDKFSSLLTIF